MEILEINEVHALMVGWLSELGVDGAAHVKLIRVGDMEVRIGDTVLNYDPPAMNPRVIGRIWTASNMYQFLASGLYLSAVVQKRIYPAGLEFAAPVDLTDGDCDRKTWEKIKTRILANEMEKLSSPVEASR